MPFHQFRGQRTTTASARRRGYSQASTRHHVRGFDQYGRPWGYEIENDSGAPCSIPQAEFSTPFMPDPEFVFVNPDNTTEVFVDNIGIARTRRNALRAYHAEAVQYASDNKQPIPAIGDYTAVIREKVGKPPRAFQPFLACEQENPYALGWDAKRNKPFAGTADPRLVEFIENPSRSFEEEFGEFDFGVESYAAATTGQKTKPTKFKSFAELKKADGGFLGVTEDDFLAESGEPETAPLSEAEQELVHDVDAATADLDALDTGAHEAEELRGFDELHDEVDHDGSVEGDQLTDELSSLEDEHDAEAMGGRTVRPDQQERAERQAPRHGNASARRKGNRTWDPARVKGKTLADGARPAIGGE